MIIICRMHIYLNLGQFWKMFCQEQVAEDLYQANIRGIRLNLVELQAKDS